MIGALYVVYTVYVRPTTDYSTVHSHNSYATVLANLGDWRKRHVRRTNLKRVMPLISVRHVA